MDHTLQIPTRIYLKMMLVVCLAVFSLTGCGKAEQQTAAPSAPLIRPALTEVISSSHADGLSFNGTVRAAERADLSFEVGGKLSELLVNEGEQVRQGQVLARLDAQQAKTALASMQIEFDNIRLEYQRTKSVYEKTQAVSKSQLDEITSRYNMAKNRLADAKRDLADTEIKAPFAGIIGRRFVDKYIQIQAKSPVFTLHNINKLEVVIHVPDNIMLSSSSADSAIATINAIPDQFFALKLESYATQADPINQAYAVVLSFSDLQGYRVLPGMTAKVHPAQVAQISNAVITLPVTAIVPDNQGKQFVWVVAQDNSVSRRFVEIGALSRDRITITANLALGEQVVIAGVSSLRDGMVIRPMTNEAQ